MNNVFSHTTILSPITNEQMLRIFLYLCLTRQDVPCMIKIVNNIKFWYSNSLWASYAANGTNSLNSISIYLFMFLRVSNVFSNKTSFWEFNYLLQCNKHRILQVCSVQTNKEKYIRVFNNEPNIILQIRFASCILYTQDHSTVLRATERVQWLLTYPPESLLIH